jgi:TetR/AcrR family transcriptional repressor of nem operon
MARPSEFDRQKAVQSAMRQIWRDGYEATSVKHLAEQLGITRSSFYNAFGTREDLFREAIVAYQALLPRFPKARGADERVLPRLTAFFRAHCAFHAENGWRGCLIANCVVELCSPKGELDKELTRCVERSVDWFQGLVDAAKRTGEITQSRDSHEIALALQSLMMGLSALAKATRDEQAIWKMTKATLTGLGLYAAQR